jgi:hypothetical protein
VCHYIVSEDGYKMIKEHRVLSRDGKLVTVKTKKEKAIKLKCYDCSGFSFDAVKNCNLENCELYDYRLGKKPKSIGARNTAIKEHCAKCVGSVRLVKDCVTKTCPLYPHRVGAEKDEIKLKKSKRVKRNK